MNVACPMCKEREIDTPMNQVGKDSRYKFYRCPKCGNEAMVAPENHVRDKAFEHLYDLSEGREAS